MAGSYRVIPAKELVFVFVEDTTMTHQASPPNELQDFQVEVDVHPPGLGMSHHQRRRKTRPGRFDGLAPSLVPHQLERHERAGHLST